MERDTVTGLNLAVKRVQDPGTGRWTSQIRPGLRAGDSNLYRYVQNTPNGFTDRLGVEPKSWYEWYLEQTSKVNQGLGVGLLYEFFGPPSTTWDSLWAYNFAEEAYPVNDLRSKLSEQQLVDANNCRYMKNNAARHIYLAGHSDHALGIRYSGRLRSRP